MMGRSLFLLIALWPVFGRTEVRATLPVVLYSTAFERSEGYDPGFTLVGQKGWVGSAADGNGLLSDFFSGEGQQAFIGFNAPTGGVTSLSAWRPLNLDPVPATNPVITFSVSMSIIDSTNKQYDCFRWSVYDTAGTRYFSVDFDNDTTLISYGLENSSNFISTGIKFTNSTLYSLGITMDFSNNTWSATWDDRPLVDSQPIRVGGSARTLGDIDAVWLIRNPATPGNNYMLFDNYRVTAQPLGPGATPFRLEAVGFLPNRQFALLLLGDLNQTYILDSSTNLFAWTPLKTNLGPFDFVDTTAPAHSRRFYRARRAPP